MDDEIPPASGCFTGCLYVLGLTIVTCVLLFINGGMVLAVFRALSQTRPGFMTNQRIVQFVLFVAPVLLLILQWMVFDIVVRVIRRR